MKFTRKDTPTIMSGKVVRYKAGLFGEISASRDGILITKLPILRNGATIAAVINQIKACHYHVISLSDKKPPYSETKLASRIDGYVPAEVVDGSPKDEWLNNALRD